MKTCKNMVKLMNMVDVNLYELQENNDTLQMIIPDADGNWAFDIISHTDSYGGKNGLLEIMCGFDEEYFGGESCKGHLTAEECFEIIADAIEYGEFKLPS